MKIKDELVEDGGVVHHVKAYDFQRAIDETATLAQKPKDDWWHVGHIPSELLGIWIKEAGLVWSDTQAVNDLIRKKLLSGEFNNLRPHQGTF